jgi:hypothetical protein
MESSVAQQHFSIVLRDSSARWTAHCESGCKWTDLSFQCTGCQWRLDADGVSSYDLDRGSSSFAFLLSSDGSGWRAKGLRGVHWIDLSYTCGDPVCRSRVDQTGVEGL